MEFGKIVRLAASVATVLSVASTAQANTINFTLVPDESDPRAQVFSDVAAQFRAELSSGPSGSAIFTFFNEVGLNGVVIKASITEIYFDADQSPLASILSLTPVQEGATDTPLKFVTGAAPPNLPGGENLSPTFNVTTGLLAESTMPIPKRGINEANEWLAIRFALQSDAELSDVEDALRDGAIRIGLHVISIGAKGESASYVNTPLAAVPDAGATAALLAISLTGLAVFGRRRL